MKYVKLFENFSVKKYRIAGSDADYTERDIVDINDDVYSKLKELLNNNNINYSIKDIITYDANLYPLDRQIIDGKISEKKSEYSYYIEAILKDIKNQYGATIFKSSIKIWEYNDGNYNISVNNNNYEKSYVCFGFEGLLEFLNDYIL